MAAEVVAGAIVALAVPVVIKTAEQLWKYVSDADSKEEIWDALKLIEDKMDLLGDPTKTDWNTKILEIMCKWVYIDRHYNFDEKMLKRINYVKETIELKFIETDQASRGADGELVCKNGVCVRYKNLEAKLDKQKKWRFSLNYSKKKQ
mmetsp:Transcript_32296/g.36164  ORF Transcript_32296/g.36164 Transcript_32296/m.36164 type:complete len:148 (-) Transcript_32296:404-847(-)